MASRPGGDRAAADGAAADSGVVLDSGAVAGAPRPDLTFTMADGTVLPARQWLPPAGTPTRRVVLALHGFNDSRDAWELPAPVLAQAGFAVFAPDQRGFGASPSRGRWAGSQRLADDAWSMAGALHARYPGLPLTVMGESMGGAVAMLVAAQHGGARQRSGAGQSSAGGGAGAAGGTRVREVGAGHAADLGGKSGGSTAGESDPGPDVSYVLLAPAVWDRAEIGPVLTTSLWVAASLAPGHQITGGEVPVQVLASDNRAALLALFRDPLTLRTTRFDVLRGLVDVMDRAAASAPLLGGQVLMLDGGHDELVPPAATAATWAALPASARRAFYPGGYHLLLRDRDRGLPTADIIAWLDDPGAWLPSGADAAAGAWFAGRGWAGEPAQWLPAQADAAGEGEHGL